MTPKLNPISAKDGSVVVGIMFAIASITPGIAAGLEYGTFRSYRFPLYSIEMTTILVCIFSVLMAIGAVRENPTLMFPWLAVIMTGMLTFAMLGIAVVITDGDRFRWSNLLRIVGAMTTVLAVTTLLWAVVYRRYNQIISPETPETFAEKSFDQKNKNIIPYHQFNNDNKA